MCLCVYVCAHVARLCRSVCALNVRRYDRAYECATCKYVFNVQADVEQFHRFPETKVCPALSEPACKGKKFRYVDGSAKCKDYQEIKLQEQLHKLGMG